MSTDLRKRKIHVLVVDNEPDILDQALAEIQGWHERVELLPCHDLNQASDAMAAHHLDLAFVDLSLGGIPGTPIVMELSVRCPSCEVLVMTKRMERLGDADGSSLVARGNSVAGIVNKNRAGAWFREIVSKHVKLLDDSGFLVEGLLGPDGLIETLRGSPIGSGVIASTDRSELLNADGAEGLRADDGALTDEVGAMLRGIFGAAMSAFQAPASDLAMPRPRLSLRRLGNGRSASVVMLAPLQHPDTSGAFTSGIATVLKFQSRSETNEELRRYERVVKFGLPSALRVELMGSALGDNLGAICYSFADETGAQFQTLSTWLASNPADADVQSVLNELLSPASWRNNQFDFPSISLHDYCETELRWDTAEAVRLLGMWIDDKCTASRIFSSAIPIDALANDVKAVSTSRRVIHYHTNAFLGSAALRRERRGVLQHGDLHGDNVMVSMRNGVPSFKLIDYRTAGIGPAYLDTAAFQASQRLDEFERWSQYSGRDGKRVGDIGALVHRYHALENRFSHHERIIKNAGNQHREWVSRLNVSTQLCLDADDREAVGEYAWTCILHCLYLWSFTSTSDWQKLRLLLWLNGLLLTIGDLRQERKSGR